MNGLESVLSPEEKEHHQHLLESLNRAKKDYATFLENTRNKYNKIEQQQDKPNPYTLNQLDEAWDYTQKHILTNESLRLDIKTLIDRQSQLERTLETTNKKLMLSRASSSLLTNFYNDCLRKTELLTREQHAVLKDMGIPLIVSTDNYDSITQDAIELLHRIHDSINNKCK